MFRNKIVLLLAILAVLVGTYYWYSNQSEDAAALGAATVLAPESEVVVDEPEEIVEAPEVVVVPAPASIVVEEVVEVSVPIVPIFFIYDDRLEYLKDQEGFSQMDYTRHCLKYGGQFKTAANICEL